MASMSFFGDPGEMVVWKGGVEVPASPVDAFVHGAPERGLRPCANPGLHVRGDVRRVDDAEGRRQRAPAREWLAALRGMADRAGADPGERLALSEERGVECPIVGRPDRRELRVPVGPPEGGKHDESRDRGDGEPDPPPPRHCKARLSASGLATAARRQRPLWANTAPRSLRRCRIACLLLMGAPPAPRSAAPVPATRRRARGSGTPASRARASRRGPPSCTSGTCGAATPSIATSGDRRGTR